MADTETQMADICIETQSETAASTDAAPTGAAAKGSELGPVLDKHNSHGPAPPKAQAMEHLLWALNSDSFRLMYKFFITLSVGGSLYIVGTLHIVLFFLLSVILPLLLFIADTATNRVFIPELTNITLARIKYGTFVVQNALLCGVAHYGSDADMATLMTWVLRLNILEVFVDCIKHRRYAYVIPSVMLLLPICGWSLSMFPEMDMVIHPKWLCYWVGWDGWFIIIYTGWFVGWIIPRSERVVYAMHTLFPLFAPPQLWFSVRTFTGMFLLWWMYLKPLHTRNIITTKESVNEREGFAEIYDAFYVFVFVGCYAMPALMTLDLVSMKEL